MYAVPRFVMTMNLLSFDDLKVMVIVTHTACSWVVRGLEWVRMRQKSLVGGPR